MTVTNSSSARKAGFRLGNRGIKKAAGIAMSKVGTRTLTIGLPPQHWHPVGAGVVVSADGMFSVMTFPDAVTSNMYETTRLPVEWITTADVVVTIYWKTAVAVGDAKLSLSIGAKADGESTASSTTGSVTTTTNTTANKLNKSQITIAAATFAAGDWIGLNISRDPTDAADTLTADLDIVNVVLEFTGRG